MTRNILTHHGNEGEIFKLGSAKHGSTASIVANPRSRLDARRSAAYVAALTQLDAGGHTLDEKTRSSIRAVIRAEFPEVSAVDLPLGIVARCHLGHPYEVHTLDCALEIIEHYKVGQSLPDAMERARTLAKHPAYLFVEVFLKQVRAVSADGTVTTIEI